MLTSDRIAKLCTEGIEDFYQDKQQESSIPWTNFFKLGLSTLQRDNLSDNKFHFLRKKEFLKGFGHAANILCWFNKPTVVQFVPRKEFGSAACVQRDRQIVCILYVQCHYLPIRGPSGRISLCQTCFRPTPTRLRTGLSGFCGSFGCQTQCTRTSPAYQGCTPWTNISFRGIFFCFKPFLYC